LSMSRKILFVSLGCDKNRVDSEKMLGLLADDGWEITDDETLADVIVVNTCCFINDAKEESINTLLEMARLKTEGNCRVLVAAGCLAERYAAEIREELPEVDAILGTAAVGEIAEVIRRAERGEKAECRKPLSGPASLKARRILTGGGHYAYLKIAEGCSKHCTYCVIPKVRGEFRSVPMEELLDEARALAAGGVKELILVAQETTRYGVDIYGEKSLHKLIRELCRIESLVWIRVLYCYPEEIYDGLIEVMRDEPKVCHYLDLPIQHADNAILKRMNRRTTQEDLRAIIANLREQVPDIVLRTTLITGFPGETQEQFEELYRFVNEMEFDRLGVFAYSQEEGTPAARMDGQIDDAVKEARRQELMELQQEISLDLAQERIGRELYVMIEGKVADEDVYVARGYGDAPDVDGYIFVRTGLTLMTGDFIRVRITGASEYDLEGVAVDEMLDEAPDET